MNILLDRRGTGLGPHDTATIGTLYVNDLTCLILEDDHDDEKEYGHTRIPAGEYEIKLRTFGGHHVRYTKRFDFHKGMLWLQDVPNYTDILIHCGQTPEDTKGCLLTGTYAVGKTKVNASEKAYRLIYPSIADAIERGETVKIKIKD